MLFRRLLPLVALALALSLVERTAKAAPIRGGEVRVQKSDLAQGCLDEEEFVRAALALGTAPEAPVMEPLVIVVVFDGDGKSLRARVSSTGRKTGERDLTTDGTDCAKLSEAVSVVIAVLLDLVPPEAVASFESPSTAPPPPPPPPAPPAPAPRPTPPPPPPAREASTFFGFLLRGEAGFAVGPLGVALSPSFGGAAGIEYGPIQLGLGGAWFVPRSAPFDAIEGTRLDLSLALGFGEGCFRFVGSLASRWDAWACARFAAGRLGAEGRGFDNEGDAQKLWLAAGPHADLRLKLHRLVALRGALGGLVTLGKHRFTVAGYGDAFSTPPLSFVMTLGPELTIF